jgi:hypothetical protein
MSESIWPKSPGGTVVAVLSVAEDVVPSSGVEADVELEELPLCEEEELLVDELLELELDDEPLLEPEELLFELLAAAAT